MHLSDALAVTERRYQRLEKPNVPVPDTTSADDKSNQDCDSKPDIEIGDSIVFQYGDYGVEALRGKVIAIEGEKLVVKFVAAADHYYIVDQSQFTVVKIDE